MSDMTAPAELLDAEAMKKAAFAVFAKANENNLSRDKIEALWPSQRYTHWDGLAETAVRAYLSAGPAPAVPDAVAPFEFDRYVNGVLMAEGVTIERQTTLAAASREAARIASRGPNGEAPVLVFRGREAALAASPAPVPDAVEALPATAPYVDRIVRIFRDRPADDTSAVVLLDYARAALASNVPVLDAEAETERKLATVVAPDNGTVDEVFSAILQCANAWVPEARIIGNVRAGDIARAVSSALASNKPVGDGDYFGTLVDRARAAASKASTKFPQPNYVTLKIAEEAGEVVRGAVHYAENRMEWSEVEGEIVQLLAMLIRFVTEGDQINGVIPPRAASSGEAESGSQRASLVRGITARCEHGEVDFEDCPKCREDALQTRSNRETGRG